MTLEENKKELISRYIDGEVSSQEKESVEEMLLHSQEAQDYYGQLRKLSVSLGKLEEEALSPDSEDKIQKNLVNALSRSKAAGKGPRMIAVGGGGVIAILFVLALSMQIYNQETTKQVVYKRVADTISPDELKIESIGLKQKPASKAASFERKAEVANLPRKEGVSDFQKSAAFTVVAARSLERAGTEKDSWIDGGDPAAQITDKTVDAHKSVRPQVLSEQSAMANVAGGTQAPSPELRLTQSEPAAILPSETEGRLSYAYKKNGVEADQKQAAGAFRKDDLELTLSQAVHSSAAVLNTEEEVRQYLDTVFQTVYGQERKVDYVKQVERGWVVIWQGADNSGSFLLEMDENNRVVGIPMK